MGVTVRMRRAVIPVPMSVPLQVTPGIRDELLPAARTAEMEAPALVHMARRRGRVDPHSADRIGDPPVGDMVWARRVHRASPEVSGEMMGQDSGVPRAAMNFSRATSSQPYCR
jgi:hypothetical protein